MYEYLQARVAVLQQNPEMGIIPAYSIVLKPFISVPTAFNSGGTDLIRVGHSSDDDAYGTDFDVSTTTTLSEFTAGVGVGFTSTARKISAMYANGGAEPTTGEAFIILPFIRVKRS